MYRLILALISVSSTFASDWLMTQGTELTFIKKEDEKGRNTLSTPQFWGFAQLKYEKTILIFFKVQASTNPDSPMSPVQGCKSTWKYSCTGCHWIGSIILSHYSLPTSLACVCKECFAHFPLSI
jgi:hypothetical protein